MRCTVYNSYSVRIRITTSDTVFDRNRLSEVFYMKEKDMLIVLSLTICCCIGMIALVLTKPSVKAKGHALSIYWVPVFAGALVLLFTGVLPFSHVWESFTANTAVNPIKVLVLFLSMTVQSVFLDEAGFFKYLASKVLEKANSNQLVLFACLYLLVSVLTVFTSNDIIILTFTPFICYFAKNAKIDPMPYLFAEFVAANTWSMALIIGNPTNIYLATTNGIDFAAYLKVMFIPTVVGGIVAFGVLYLIFAKRLKKPIEGVSKEEPIKEKKLMIIGLAHLSLCVLLLTVSSYIGIEMWLITLGFAVSLMFLAVLYRLVAGHGGYTVKGSIKRLPYEIIPFVLSMFVLVLALDESGFGEFVSGYLSGKNSVMKYGVSSFLVSNIMNNIPMSVLFSSILSNAPEVAHKGDVYAAIVGSNLGAFFTPMGALAGIMWSGILKKSGVRFNYLMFIKYGVAVSVPTLVATLLALYIML